MLTANHTHYTHYNLSAETALQKLMEGNDRYVLDHPHEGGGKRG
jgi:carbonic anhydrase